METLKKFIKDTYDITAELINPIGAGLVNTNYYVQSPVGEYLIKRYNQKSANEVRFETDFLQALEYSAVPVPRLVMSKAGEVLSIFEGKPWVVYQYIEGMPMSIITESLLREVGVIMARLHIALCYFRPTVSKTTWEPADLKQLVSNASDNLKQRGYQYAPELCSFVLSELGQFDFSPSLPRGITHQDIKPENILVHEGRISGIVDFDNSYFGTLIDDITTAIIWMCFENKKLIQSRVDALLAGYESVRPLVTVERECLYERIRFRLLREVFISPYAATEPDKARERSDYFRKLYKNFNNIKTKNGVLP